MKRIYKVMSVLLAAVITALSLSITAGAAVSDIPKEMLDNWVLDALAYTGYEVELQKKDNTSTGIYQYNGCGTRTPLKYLSGVHYGTSATGLETAGGKPSISGIKNKGGFCCASFVAYCWLNYLPNVKGSNPASKMIMDALKKYSYGNTMSVSSWQTALNKLSSQGKVKKVGTSTNNVDRSKLVAGDIIIFGTSYNPHMHIGVYLGTYRGDDYMAHVGGSQGPAIQTVRNIGYAGALASYPNGYYHIEGVTQDPKSVSLSRNRVTRGVGDAYQLKATVSPSYAKTSYTWTSSNNKVVSVDKNGKITPKKPGTAVITVKTKNGKTARCNVTVRSAPNSISLSRNKATRGAGDSYQLTATLPKGTMGTYQWSSSNNKVVSVDKNGKINPIKAGKATITVKTYNGKTASCNVTVRNAPSYVKLSRSKATRGAGDSYQLTTKLPANSMATFKWSSSDKSIVSVDKNGKINPIKAGKATITVKTYNGKTASCNVTVKKAPSYIRLSRSTATRGVGDSYQLTTKLPAGSMATVSWSSSNSSVVSVDKNGMITPLSVGKATITVKTYNGKSAACEVTSRKAPDSVKLDVGSKVMDEGDSYQLTAKLPAGSMATYSWKSSSNSVVSADKNGKITAQRAGGAVVTVTTYNGEQASCRITVKK